MNAVQMFRVLFAQHHEELAAAGILAGVRHRKCAHFVGARIARCLALDRPSRAAGTDAGTPRRQVTRQRVAALHDKVRDYAVKFHAIVELVVGELLEVRHRERGVLVVQFGRDRAEIGFENGCFWHRGKLARQRCGWAEVGQYAFSAPRLACHTGPAPMPDEEMREHRP